MTIVLDSPATTLLSPAQLQRTVVASDRARAVVDAGRDATRDILSFADDRLLVVVGPCSIHDTDAALDYAVRLAGLADRVSGELHVVMRTYFEKPRTAVGWKGLLSDPHLDGSYDLATGLAVARKLLCDIAELGLSTAAEFLDPLTAGHLEDLIGYGAIGARTAASQTHRQMVSGLAMPVGIKNATDGDVQIAVDGLRASVAPHVFPGIDADGRLSVVSTEGNPDAHVILRGGNTGPNYDAPSVSDALARIGRVGLPRRVVVDASHGNSVTRPASGPAAKDHLKQRDVLSDIASRISAGEEGMVGVMAESFLVDGRQDLVTGRIGDLTYGQSVTDACLGWEATASSIEMLAAAVSARRGGGTAH